METTLLLIFLLTIFASFIQRVSGFGFGIFVMMFFPFFLPSYGESITLSGLLAGTTAMLIAIRNFKYIRWSLMWIIVLFNILVSYIAIEYMVFVSNEILKRCLGALLVIIALYFMLCDGRIKPVIGSKFSQSVVGALSGCMGGMFAMPGPPVVLYCISAIGDKREYIATLQAFSVIFNVFYTIFRANVGFFSDNIPSYWIVGLMGLVVGAWLGSRCFEYISSAMLKRIVYVMMIISGAIAMI